MSTRKLEVVITGDSRGLQRVVGSTNRDMGKLESASRRAARGVLTVAAAAGTAAIAFGALVGAVGTRELLEQEKVTAQTEARLKSTANAANVTREQVEALASSLQNLTGMQDDEIQSAENLLLTFTRIRNEAGRGNDIFNQATKVALDLSVAFGKDLPSSAVLVGKALNDPIRGLTALGRVGVQFTQQQKEQIKTLVESNRSLDAQKIILRELNTQVGGSAKAFGDTTAGQVEKAKRNFEDLSEALMAKVLPTVVAVAESIRRNWPAIERTTRQVFLAVQRVVKQVMDYIDANVIPTIRAIVTGARAFWARFGGDITKAFNLVRAVVQNNMRAVLAIITGILAVLRGDWGTAWNSLKTVVSSAIKGVYIILRGVPSVILGIAANIGRAIVQGIVSGIQSSASAIGSALRGAVQSAVSSVGSVSGLDLAKKAIGLDELGDPARRGLRTAAPGSSLDLERVSGAGDRGARQARMTAETSARGAGKDAAAVRREGDRAYTNARLGTINQLRGKIKTRRNALLKALAAARKALAAVKVPSVRGKGAAAEKSARARQAALDQRARIQANISAIQDELETIYNDDVGYVVEASELGEELKEIDRADEAAQQEAAADAAAAARQAVSDQLDAQVALAALTEGNADDIAAAQAVEAQAAADLAAAQASGDNSAIASAARALASARQSLEQLQATKDNTEAIKENTEAQQKFGGSTTFGFRGQDFVLRSLAPPSSDRDALLGGLV